MYCVFQNIDPPPSPPGECVPPPLLRGEDTFAGWRGGWGGGVNILEDARHSSVFYLYRILFDLPRVAMEQTVDGSVLYRTDCMLYRTDCVVRSCGLLFNGPASCQTELQLCRKLQAGGE
jgi:hypothetical protein